MGTEDKFVKINLKSQRKDRSNDKEIWPQVLMGDRFSAYKETPEGFGLVVMSRKGQTLQLDPVSTVNDFF